MKNMEAKTDNVNSIDQVCDIKAPSIRTNIINNQSLPITLESNKIKDKELTSRKNVTKGTKLNLGSATIMGHNNNINPCNMGTDCKSSYFKTIDALIFNCIDRDYAFKIVQTLEDHMCDLRIPFDLNTFLKLIFNGGRNDIKKRLQAIFRNEQKAVNAIYKELYSINCNITELTGYDVDHIIPREESLYNKNLSAEDLDHIKNYQMLCRICHNFKTCQESHIKQFSVKTWKQQFKDYFETDDGKLFAKMRQFNGTVYGKLPDWEKIKNDCKC